MDSEYEGLVIQKEFKVLKNRLVLHVAFEAFILQRVRLDVSAGPTSEPALFIFHGL